MKIAIVGGHQRTKYMAPFMDESWTICATSPRNVDFSTGLCKLARVDEWYEVHDMAPVEAKEPHFAAFIRRCPFVWMQDRLAGYPGSRALPLDDLTRAFGSMFLKNTVSIMLAHAIYRKPERLGVYGVEQSADDGMGGNTRLAVQHFIKIAEERGIPVDIPAGCGLMDDEPVYGYEQVAA